MLNIFQGLRLQLNKGFSILLGFWMLTANAQAYDGYAYKTQGGTFTTTECEVTSTADSGAGTLREVLTHSGCIVHFAADVNQITLTSPILITNLHNITLDGKGLILNGGGIYIIDSHDIVLQNLRIRNTPKYGILISAVNPGVSVSYNIVVDHCSITDASRQDMAFGKDIDINQGSRDITIANSIIGYTDADALNNTTDPNPDPKRGTSNGGGFKGMLITNQADDPDHPELNPTNVSNISLLNNLFYRNFQRSPEISTTGMFDIRNNVIFNWHSYGMRMREGAFGNLEHNVFIAHTPNTDEPQSRYHPDLAVVLESSAQPWYLHDNIGVSAASTANQSYALPAVNPPVLPINEVLASVLANVGAQPRDPADQTIINTVKDLEMGPTPP